MMPLPEGHPWNGPAWPTSGQWSDDQYTPYEDIRKLEMDLRRIIELEEDLVQAEEMKDQLIHLLYRSHGIREEWLPQAVRFFRLVVFGEVPKLTEQEAYDKWVASEHLLE
jgi:hypothetical protein